MMTRGIKHDSERFANELAAKYLKFHFKGKEGGMQVAMRPIQLWEVVFPEEHYDMMMNTLVGGSKDGMPPELEKYNFMINLIRNQLKKLGVEEVKPYKADPLNAIACYRENVQRIILGIKYDRYEDDNDGTGNKSEML